jgi:hypothetical protein
MRKKFNTYNPYKTWKFGDFPCDPVVYISIDNFQRKDERFILSSSLASDGEIDYVVDQLINDLESTRKEAKRILLKQREKIKGL